MPSGSAGTARYQKAGLKLKLDHAMVFNIFGNVVSRAVFQAGTRRNGGASLTNAMSADDAHHRISQ